LNAFQSVCAPIGLHSLSASAAAAASSDAMPISKGNTHSHTEKEREREWMDGKERGERDSFIPVDRKRIRREKEKERYIIASS